jgi:uncharacterized tellurite resistance protein B-like protein
MSIFKYFPFGSRRLEQDASELGDTATVQRIARELEQLDPARARYLAAFAYVLGRAAYADARISDEETTKMLDIVQVLGHLPAGQATLVVEIAKHQVRLFGGTENFLVTREFKDIATPQERLELLECVFAVSAADDSITTIEDSQARQISRELGLSHHEYLAARSAYLDQLEVLKDLRRKRR